MKAALLRVVLFTFLPLTANRALADNMEHHLNSQYRGKILALRFPVTGDSQEFDIAGRPINSAPPGPWTVYGRVKIKSINLGSRALEVKAARQAMEFQNGGLVPIDLHKKVTLTLRLNAPVKDEADAEAAWRKLFAVTPEDIVKSAPDFWRDYLADPEIAANNNTHNPDLPPGVARLGEKGVLPAKALQAFPPGDLTDVARKFRYQGSGVYGVLINKDGEPERIYVIRPGLGLDEACIEAIKHWVWVPAIMDQKPVPSYMSVEISFNFF